MFFVRVFCLLVVIFPVIEYGLAEPRPDFAVNGQITGTSTITQLALDSKAIFVSMTSTALVLNGGYQRMQTVKTALDTIASKLSTSGQALTQAIATLSANNNGPIATYFDAVTTALNNLRSLISGGLSTQLNTITAHVNKYIAASFTDSFNELASTLTKVSQALAAMRTAVQSARTAAGNTNPIPVATMRRYVTAVVVNNVNSALRLLSSDLPILVYILQDEMGLLQKADNYLLSITAEMQLRAQDVITQTQSFSGGMVDYVNAIKSTVSVDLQTPYNAILAKYTANVKPTLTAVSGYQTQFAPIFSTMDSIYAHDTELYSTIDAAFNAFAAGALLLDNGQLQFYGVTVCTVLQDLIQVLIENGPNAQFCFSKYSQQVFNEFVINTYDTTDCYRLAMVRLDSLQTTMINIVQLIVNDILDFFELTQTCTLFHNKSSCTTYLAGEYTKLLALTTTKRGYLERLVTKEMQASLLRLTSCIDDSKHLLMLDSETIDFDIGQCKVTGPVAP